MVQDATRPRAGARGRAHRRGGSRDSSAMQISRSMSPSASEAVVHFDGVSLTSPAWPGCGWNEFLS